MTSIPASDLEGHDREKRLIRVLYAHEGQRMAATDLMKAIRIPSSVVVSTSGDKHLRPHTAYVEFVNLLIRVERFFAHRGFVLRRSGGTPFHEIWIEQMRSS